METTARHAPPSARRGGWRRRRREPAAWPPRRPDAWLARPGFLVGAGSIIDLTGSSRWYDPRRLTPQGSNRALAGDLVVVGRDLRRAIRAAARAQKVESAENAPRLFDPDEL